MEDHVAERLAALEANDKNIFHQLDEVKREMKDTRQLTIAVKELAISSQKGIRQARTKNIRRMLKKMLKPLLLLIIVKSPFLRTERFPCQPGKPAC